MKKRFLSMLLTLCLLLGLSITAFAADTSRAYTFDLTANGAHEISVKTGDIITVTLELERTSGSGAMYAMQDEINYDDKYLSLQSSGELLYTGCKSSDISLLTGGRSHYLNFVSTSGGADWADSVTVGTFRLKVTYDGKATTKLKNCNYLVSTADGQDSYKATANDVTIKINGGAENGSDVLNTETHIAYTSGYPDGTVRPNASRSRTDALPAAQRFDPREQGDRPQQLLRCQFDQLVLHQRLHAFRDGRDHRLPGRHLPPERQYHESGVRCHPQPACRCEEQLHRVLL